jgi:hypothetical protein
VLQKVDPANGAQQTLVQAASSDPSQELMFALRDGMDPAGTRIEFGLWYIPNP